jgi:hypothetical protein
MAEFNPSPHDRLRIGGHSYEVMPHPSVPSFAFGQEGRKAFVYQLGNETEGTYYALKKFKQAYRVPELVDICNSLARFSGWPGLEVCNRRCLQAGIDDDAMAEFPDLEYAVLMPWITGSTWYDVVVGEKPFSKVDALTIAAATTQVLAALEESGLAHCDIAAPNVIINLASRQTHLIDVEDLFAPGFEVPGALPAGTAGYAHLTASSGLWNPYADRFAGAVLIAEMVSWHDQRIRKASDEEHFFGPAEMQQDCQRYQLMLTVLKELDLRLGELFEQAWRSPTLDSCPPFKDWNTVIKEAYHLVEMSKLVSNWQPIMAAAPAASVEPSLPIVPEPISVPPQPHVERTTSAIQPPPSSSPSPIVPPAPKTQMPVATSQPQVGPAGKIVAPPAANPVLGWRPLGVTVVEDHTTTASSTGIESATPVVATPSPVEEQPLKPLLDLSHVDKLNRPLLVWSESPGAEFYILEESTTPGFDSPKEHRVKSSETRWRPILGRSGRLYYRVQGRSADISSPWSDTLEIRIKD